MPYINFSEDDLYRANTADLVSFLQSHGGNVKKVGSTYKYIYTDGSGTHDSVTIYGGKWYDHKNQRGGYAVKFLQEFLGFSFQDSVIELLGGHCSTQSVRSAPKETPKPVVKPFELPEPNSDMRRVFAYLTKQRFIAPDIISHFAHEHKIYEDSKYHNVVFVGTDENGAPKQASVRSTISFGKTFRITVANSDTKYSFSHFGNNEKLFVFEAPIDMLSYLTLNPESWQKNSYIAMNGVYENAVLTALKGHSNLSEIIICTDKDVGGIDAADRLKDILYENNYKNILRIFPQNKDFNEDLKQLNGVEFLPAVPHKIKEEYHRQAENLQYLKCRPDKLASQIYAAFKNNQYGYLAEYALAGSAFFLPKTQRISDENRAFLRLQSKLRDDYRTYADKGKTAQKQRNLSDSVQAVMRDLKQTARTREQSVNTAKLLFQLADNAVRMSVEEAVNIPVREQHRDVEFVREPEPCMEFG